MLVELNKVEQRYRIVLKVLEEGRCVTDVAAQHGISRQTLHTWLRRYQELGMAGLVEHSRRPQRPCVHHIAPPVELAICQLRRLHPSWGPQRLVYELGKRGVSPLPGRTTAYRVLERNQLIEPIAQRRQRAAYVRWERSRPMELWQMDVVGFRLADGTMASILTGIDDHSRFCVCATVMQRADARSVCTAFSAALMRHGVPDQLLTDNGRVFTGRLTRPHPVTVLFDRICQQQGIRHLLTKPRSPTTTGKVERFHRSLRRELLDDAGFTSLEAAQAGVDAYMTHYNTERPHQALGMRTPAQRFHYDELARAVVAPVSELETRVLVPLREAAAAPQPHDEFDDGGAIRRAASEGGNLHFGGALYYVGRRYGRRAITIVPDKDWVRFYVDGQLIRTLPRIYPANSKRDGSKEVVLYRNTRKVTDVTGSASVKEEVDLVRQA